MFRAILLIASLIGASAFAPIGRNTMRSSLKVAIASAPQNNFLSHLQSVLMKISQITDVLR